MLLRSSRLLFAGALSLVASAIACSATTNPNTFDTGGGGSGNGAAPPASTSASTGASGGSGGSGGDPSFLDGGPQVDSGGDACGDVGKFVYVVGTGNELVSFHPPTLAFKNIGYINCPQPGGGFASPFSMAVDRSGKAWVLFNDGNIYNVDTTTAQCTATAFVPNQHPDFSLFGMGFVSDAVDSEKETLYLGSYNGAGIAKLDTQTLQVVPVGNYNAINTAAEMTGTGDARLFGFFSGTVTVAEIDKSNAHILNAAPQPTVQIGSGWAFAFWGGNFWLFTAPSGFSSQVDKYDPIAHNTTTVVPDVGGFTIVGAGVSTCAPTKPPS